MPYYDHFASNSDTIYGEKYKANCEALKTTTNGYNGAMIQQQQRRRPDFLRTCLLSRLFRRENYCISLVPNVTCRRTVNHKLVILLSLRRLRRALKVENTS